MIRLIPHVKDVVFGAPAERSDRLMGTHVYQRVYGLDAAHCCELARAEISRLEQLWSVFRPNSEVSTLARQAGLSAVKVAPDTLAILSQARSLHEFTDGAFDVTAGPLIELWRSAAARGVAPTADELDSARALVDGASIELHEPCKIGLPRAGQRIDLGAIGKGYAADRCIAIYNQHGIRHGLVDLGGNVAVLGGKPDGSPWRVGLQIPGRERGDAFGWLEVRDLSVVTSGNYERGYQVGKTRYSHLIDPRTGVPLPDDAFSVTVVHASSMLADALSTALLVMGPQRAYEFALEHSIDAVLYDAGVIQLTPGLFSMFGA